MGHVTAVGASPEAALTTALRGRRPIDWLGDGQRSNGNEEAR